MKVIFSMYSNNTEQPQVVRKACKQPLPCITYILITLHQLTLHHPYPASPLPCITITLHYPYPALPLSNISFHPYKHQHTHFIAINWDQVKD